MGLLTVAIVGVDDLEFLQRTKKSTGMEWRETIYRSAEKMPRIRRSIKYVLTSISTAKLGVMSSRTWTHNTPNCT